MAKKTRKTKKGVESETTTTTSSKWVMNTKGRSAEVEKPKSNGGKFRFQPRPWRFRLKAGTSAKIIFLSNYDDSTVIREHKFDLLGAGKPVYGNMLTCAEMIGEECPLCKVKRKYDIDGLYLQVVRLFSIIDTRHYKPKNGPEKLYQKLILAQPEPMERQFLRMASRCAEKRKTDADLRGAVFEVDRPDEQRSCAIGTDYHFTRFQKLRGSKNYAEEDTVPYPDDDFGVNMELLSDAASLLTERMAYDNDEEEEEDADDVPY